MSIPKNMIRISISYHLYSHYVLVLYIASERIEIDQHASKVCPKLISNLNELAQKLFRTRASIYRTLNAVAY